MFTYAMLFWFFLGFLLLFGFPIFWLLAILLLVNN